MPNSDIRAGMTPALLDNADRIVVRFSYKMLGELPPETKNFVTRLARKHPDTDETFAPVPRVVVYARQRIDLSDTWAMLMEAGFRSADIRSNDRETLLTRFLFVRDPSVPEARRETRRAYELLTDLFSWRAEIFESDDKELRYYVRHPERRVEELLLA